MTDMYRRSMTEVVLLSPYFWVTNSFAKGPTQTLEFLTVKKICRFHVASNSGTFCSASSDKTGGEVHWK